MLAHKRETLRVIEDDPDSYDIGEDPTLLAEPAAVEHAMGEKDSMPPVPEDTVDVSGLPVVEFDGLADEVERLRVQQSLFGGSKSSSSFQLGRFVIAGTLGRGGMGVVFRAVDPDLDRLVALKVLHAELDEQHTIRLRREAQAMAKLSHPNVVHVHEVGDAGGRTFVAMELVKGQTLREWMHHEPRPTWRQCVEVFIQVGAGLSAAHKQGLIHRDFKPGNAIIDEEGRPRVLDFGLARKAGDVDNQPLLQQARTDQQKVVPLHVSLTHTGAVLGTPAYMPPEQMRGEEADARSDQFSFCVALWEAVYGERPFAGSSMAGLMISMMGGDVRPVPKGSAVPGTLRAMLQRGLAVDSAERWPSMEALLSELRRLLAPRRWRWLAGGLALGLAVLGTALAAPQFVAMQQRCSGAQAQLDGIWDDARRQEVKGAVLGTELSYAEGTWERIESQLDEYADAWAGKHTEVCEATTVRYEQTEDAMTLRMSCLAEHRTALRATVNVLADADAETKTVENAVKIVTGLPDLSRCDDVERLEQQRQRMPPPEDPQVAEAVQEQRDQLAVIEAIQRAGRYAEALAQVQSVVEQAKALDYGPLLAEARYRQGDLLHRDGQYVKAEQELMHAHTLALEYEHVQVELHTVQVLTALVGGSLARYDDGLTWGQSALALAKRSDDDLELAGSLNNLGIVFESFGKYEQAKLHYQRALQTKEKVHGLDHPNVAATLNNLGGVFGTLGEYEQAKLYFERALRIRRKALGPDHPKLAASLNNLGDLFRTLGDNEQAAQYDQRALSILEKALGPDHPRLAANLNNMGLVLYVLGKYEESNQYHQRALLIRERALGPDHPKLAVSLSNLGLGFKKLGEYEQAKIHFERALRIFEKVLGSDHPKVAMLLGNLGNLLKDLGEYEQAKIRLERCLRILEKALGPEHPRVATSLNNLGVVFERLGEYEDAKQYFQRALRVKEKALGPDHLDVAYPLVGLANVALARHDPMIAREHAERALSIREKGSAAPESLALARLLLARALWSDKTQRGRARRLAEQAREAFAEVDKSQEENLAEVESWLAKHRVR